MIMIKWTWGSWTKRRNKISWNEWICTFLCTFFRGRIIWAMKFPLFGISISGISSEMQIFMFWLYYHLLSDQKMAAQCLASYNSWNLLTFDFKHILNKYIQYETNYLAFFFVSEKFRWHQIEDLKCTEISLVF